MTLKELKELRFLVESELYDDERFLKLIDEQIRMKENNSYVKLAKCPKCKRKPQSGFVVAPDKKDSGYIFRCCELETRAYKKERDARIAWNQIVEEKKNEQIN